MPLYLPSTELMTDAEELSPEVALLMALTADMSLSALKSRLMVLPVVTTLAV